MSVMKKSSKAMALLIGAVLFGHVGVANALTVLSLQNASGGWNEATIVDQEVLLSKGFTTGDWSGSVDVGSTEASPGTLFSMLFEVKDPFQGQVAITGPNGLNQVLGAGSSELLLPITLVAGTNTFNFNVTGTGGAQWILSAAITAVPLPAAAWLFISALGALVLVGRRRRMHATA
jgi:hypothetical protein